MRGPQGKGHAEMAVSRVAGSGPETPEQTPNTEAFPIEDFEQVMTAAACLNLVGIAILF